MSNDNKPASLKYESLDIDALFNIRAWVERAIIASGGKIIGAGVGCDGPMGLADLDVELEGHVFAIEIRPIKSSQP